jgi:hypothetical protein
VYYVDKLSAAGSPKHAQIWDMKNVLIDLGLTIQELRQKSLVLVIQYKRYEVVWFFNHASFATYNT